LPTKIIARYTDNSFENYFLHDNSNISLIKILRVVTLKYQLILTIKNFLGNTVIRIAKKSYQYIDNKILPRIFVKRWQM